VVLDSLSFSVLPFVQNLPSGGCDHTFFRTSGSKENEAGIVIWSGNVTMLQPDCMAWLPTRWRNQRLGSRFAAATGCWLTVQKVPSQCSNPWRSRKAACKVRRGDSSF